MNILMTGGTGFIGKKLLNQLVLEGHHIHVLTRYPKKHTDTAYITYISDKYPMKRLPFIHAVINLAGESIFGYWSTAKKNKMLNSRLDITHKLTKMMIQMEKKPDVFITGSAVGYYGMSDDTIFTENTTKSGDDFLGYLSSEWEKAAATAEDLGIRTVYTRFGIVLDKHKGALSYMAIPFKTGIGGKIGSGAQWMSWIHIEDCINLILFALYNKKVTGPLNMTAPFPRQNHQFSKVLAKTLHRPNLFPAPAFFIKKTMGEMHQLLTNGQYVYPQKALDYGFSFEYPQLEMALHNIYQ